MSDDRMHRVCARIKVEIVMEVRKKQLIETMVCV